MAPIVLFGLYSLHKGWYFVPNPLMVTWNAAPLTLSVAGLFAYFSKGYNVIMSQEHVPPLVLVITLLAHDWPEEPFSSYWRSASGAMHALTLVLAVFLFGTSQWPRMSNSYPHIVSGSYSIYGQKYQMGRFVRQFYKSKELILSDICTVSFMGEGNSLLDIAGLSDIEVLRLRRIRVSEPADRRHMSEEHHAPIAIVHDSWIKAIIGGPLPEWVKVGTWTIPINTVSAGGGYRRVLCDEP